MLKLGILPVRISFKMNKMLAQAVLLFIPLLHLILLDLLPLYEITLAFKDFSFSDAKTVRKSMSKTLPGLGSFYMAGQWVYAGGGVPGAIMSGRLLMQIICKKDRRSFEATTP